MTSTDAPADPAVRLTAGDGHVTVRGLAPEERRRLEDAWSRCDPHGVPEGAADEALDRGSYRSWDAFHEAAVFQATTAAIDAGRGSRLMLHAACLAAPGTGAAIALAAASGTGKTTATRRLGPHFAYLTDETAIVDPVTLAVTPYAKPLSLLGPDGRRPKTQAGPDELGLGGTVADAQLTRVAVLDRVREPEEAVAPRAEPLPLVDALEAIVPQTSSLSLLPRGLVTLCGVLDRVGGVRRLVYAEADGLRPLVADLLAEPPQPLTPTWEALADAELTPSPGVEEGPQSPSPADGRVRRRGATDGVLTAEGALVLLKDTRLAVLEGLGPALWFLLEQPLTPAELVARLAAQGPAPADAEARVAEAVAALASHGLVTDGR